MKKIFKFIKDSYKPWTVRIIVYLLVALIVWSVILTYHEKSTIQEQINYKKTEIKIAEQKAEEAYQLALKENEVGYERCKQELSEGKVIFRPGRLYPITSCDYFRVLYKSEPTGLKSELKALEKISDKSWLKIFSEALFSPQNYDDSPLYFLFLLTIAFPLIRFFIIFLKRSLNVSQIILSMIKESGTKIQKLPIFQKYILISLGLIVIMFAAVIALQIF